MKAKRARLLLTGEVARVLDVTSEGVRYLERRGQLRAQRTISGRRLFAWGEVERLAAARDAERRRHGRAKRAGGTRARAGRSV